MITQTSQHPILLWGMTGVGKSTVGRHLAALSDRPFIDLDEVIERDSGQGIAAIFQTHGESTFRRLEHDALRTTLRRNDGPVVALGGGCLLSAETRRLAKLGGPVVCLTAQLDTLLTRLEDAPARPLLGTAPTAPTLEALLAARASAYADTDITIATDDLSVDEVAHAILSAVSQERAA